MRIIRFAALVLGTAVIIASPTAIAADLVVQSQVVGLMQANCYLLYDTESKEAAIFDVAGPVDSLTQTIREKEPPAEVHLRHPRALRSRVRPA
ncbi:MAG: MBL fold metallo-hydrolase [Acidobacteria bacterium]|nr:MAG: MBL fold metallo-hydrolase [Acidobacteriota bacterium]